MEKYILDNYDDENDKVEWVKNLYFNCGCCDECSCNAVECRNCSCDCQVLEDELDIPSIKPIEEYTIDIIEDSSKERKVRLTFNLEIANSSKTILFDLDISRSLYLKIADELEN